uniref:Uncharacterized protein n=1 Tax=Quercus lobata TaxID=97700 RepID=A0A7N2LI04_QUELO
MLILKGLQYDLELVTHQLVFLPLPGRRGSRCSVNPASRCALFSRSNETQGLRSSLRAQFLAWNGRTSKEATITPSQLEPSQCSNTFMPPLELKVHATKPGELKHIVKSL